MHHALLSRETIHQGWGRYVRVKARMADGSEVEREVEDHGHAVGVLPYDPERKVALLVRQLRMGPLLAGDDDPLLLEVPAGMIEDESAAASAAREAMEEVGVRLHDLEPWGSPYSTAGVSTERITLFTAKFTRADMVGVGGGLAEEHEEIEVVEMPLAELWTLIALGRSRDLKTIALCSLLRAHRPELFS